MEKTKIKLITTWVGYIKALIQVTHQKEVIVRLPAYIDKMGTKTYYILVVKSLVFFVVVIILALLLHKVFVDNDMTNFAIQLYPENRITTV